MPRLPEERIEKSKFSDLHTNELSCVTLSMIRFGVCSLKQLYANRLKDVLGRQKSISIELYEELAHSDTVCAEEYQEMVLSRFKFGQVYKRTHRNRFAAFDNAVLSVARKQFGDTVKATLRFHDVAASDGRTSVDLYDELSKLYHDRLWFLATDILPWVYTVAKPGQHLKLVTDDSGHIIELIYPPFVFDLGRRESPFYWINHIIVKRLLKQASALAALFVQRSCEVRVTKIELIHNKCRELIERKSNFRFERYNVFEPINHRFDMVRAMNILNRCYFSQVELRRILQAVFSSLRIGGLFATGSNEAEGSEVEGGIYLRTANGFELLFRSCSGSTVDDLITGFN